MEQIGPGKWRNEYVIYQEPVYEDNDGVFFVRIPGKDKQLEQEVGRVMRGDKHDRVWKRLKVMLYDDTYSTKKNENYKEFTSLPKTVKIIHPEQRLLESISNDFQFKEKVSAPLITDRLVFLIVMNDKLHKYLPDCLERKLVKSSTLLTDILMQYFKEHISIQICLQVIDLFLKAGYTIEFDHMLVSIIGPEWQTLTARFIEAGFDINTIHPKHKMSFTHWLIFLNAPPDIIKRVIKLGGVYINALSYIGNKLPETVILKLIENGALIPDKFIDTLDKNTLFYSLIVVRDVPDDTMMILNELKVGNIDKVIKMINMGVNIKGVEQHILKETADKTDSKYKQLHEMVSRL